MRGIFPRHFHSLWASVSSWITSWCNFRWQIRCVINGPD